MIRVTTLSINFAPWSDYCPMQLHVVFHQVVPLVDNLDSTVLSKALSLKYCTSFASSTCIVLMVCKTQALHLVQTFSLDFIVESVWVLDSQRDCFTFTICVVGMHIFIFPLKESKTPYVASWNTAISTRPTCSHSCRYLHTDAFFLFLFLSPSL